MVEKTVLFLSLATVIQANSGNRRLVLHSGDDIANAITVLQSKVTGLESELASSKIKISQLETELSVIKHAGSCGATYIRWGRTACPSNGTEFVYKGFMAGDKWNEEGGGSNQLCLPEDPTWDKYVDGYNNGATIYGTEIELDSTVSSTIFGKQASNQDIPCAVCRTTRASHLMLPARADCYPGWTKEYGGYIISAHPSWKGNADYVCLDAGFEFVPHGAASDDDHVVRPVEVRCGTYGSLPCPPYADGRELACAVCTK